MTQPISIMLDTETWGTEPGCDIRSIGAAVFAPETGLVHDGSLGTIRPFYIACDNPNGNWGKGIHKSRFFENHRVTWERKYPLHRDPRTVQWWSEQSDEAQAAFADPVDLRECLRQFGKWLRSVSPLQDYYDIGEHDRQFPDDIRLWSHGPAFDPPILAAAYKAVGLPVPWHYRAPRDTRTCFDMAGIDDHSAWLKQHPGPMGIPHHSLDDSICQARAVCAAYKRLEIPHDVVTHRDAWHGALEQLDQQEQTSEECFNVGYYKHERRVFVDTFDRLAEHPRLEQ